MSKIFDLIKRLCPDGVEFRELGDEVNPLTILKRGRVIAKTDLYKKVGNYPVYSSQTINGGEIGKIDTFDFDGEFVTWTTDGANAGTVFYRNGKFSITNVCGLIEIKDTSKLNYKFLFYWLSIEAKKHVHSGMGNAKLMSHQMAKIKLPVPPMEVQREIVRILDSFTLLTAELTAELTARKKQYEFYRDFLLSFDELDKNGGCELKTLGEICELIRGNGLQKKDFVESGVPAIHYGQIYTYYGTFASKTKSFVSVDTARNLKKVNFGDVVITNTSENLQDVGKAVVYLGKEQAVTGGHATILKPKNTFLGKFFVYLSQTAYFYNEKVKYAKGTKVIDVSASDMSKILIPVPSLQTQQKVVEILDKFDTLVNSITEGLPREIELRRKQYEHYRELLLNFKPKMRA